MVKFCYVIGDSLAIRGQSVGSNDQLLDNDFLIGQTIMGKVQGTPGYMAPELVEDKKKRCLQTDIYALGAVLYSMLTRCQPYEGDTEAILAQTISGQLKSPIERSPELAIPASLNAVVLKAMQSKIENRYDKVEQLISDVQKYLYGYSTTAENAGFLKELSLFYKRNKTVCLVTGIFSGHSGHFGLLIHTQH